MDVFKQSIQNQFEAALATIESCVNACDDDDWLKPIVNLTFSQATFHALFFCDVYLGKDLQSLKEQPFHTQHADAFGEYEELEDRQQTQSYTKNFVRLYIQHCGEKADSVIAAETPESLARTPGFDWLDFSRAEVHVYNLRHLFHHTAQLSLHLRIRSNVDTPWIRSGRRN